MFKKIIRAIGIGLAALIVTGGVLYVSGFRIVLDGGGGLHVAREKSAEQRAEAVARHREAQRAVAPPASPAPQSAPGIETPAPSTSAPSTPALSTPHSAPSTSVTAYWTDFRGPARDGHYRERPVLTSWPGGGPKPLWKQPVGGGYASFVVAGGRAFTIEQRGPDEAATAYDVATGREVWANTWTAAFKEIMGGDGPRATPTWHDGRVFALGGAGELRAIDAASGRTVWRTNILIDAGASNLQWGMSAAPLIVGNTVVVLPGGHSGQSVVAYDAATGKRAWAALDDQASYSSPMLVTVAGVRQIVLFTATRLVGITPERGELLWEFPWKTEYEVNASQPVVIGADRLFVSTGYGTGAATLELSQAGGRFAVREVWRSNRMKNQFTSSVLHDGFLYGLDESILACLDAATGELKWKGGRYGYGQVMLTDGHLIVLTESGELALVRATPTKHEELARFPVLDGKTWNHPAMSDGYLLVRNINEMAAFDLRK
ncbi:MAG TPA: PQQ-binding-like beta-propeller repeat protein [Vicinamibacterales bacterium]|nr:PQQ-binding-like beta-propeller repeat protein [Vicinamibacterales bacterium]